MGEIVITDTLTDLIKQVAKEACLKMAKWSDEYYFHVATGSAKQSWWDTFEDWFNTEAQDILKGKHHDGR